MPVQRRFHVHSVSLASEWAHLHISTNQQNCVCTKCHNPSVRWEDMLVWMEKDLQTGIAIPRANAAKNMLSYTCMPPHKSSS